VVPPVQTLVHAPQVDPLPAARKPLPQSRPGGFGALLSRFMHRPKAAVPADAGALEGLSVAERIARDFGNVSDRGGEAAQDESRPAG
jgi:hypothetical protein